MAKRAKKPFAKAPLGSGKRFAACVRKMTPKYGKEGAKRVCAAIGIKTYGKKKFMQLAAKGRKKK